MGAHVDDIMWASKEGYDHIITETLFKVSKLTKSKLVVSDFAEENTSSTKITRSQ